MELALDAACGEEVIHNDSSEVTDRGFRTWVGMLLVRVVVHFHLPSCGLRPHLAIVGCCQS